MVYAIASADGVVKPDERYLAHQYIEKHMVTNERTYDSSGMNNAYYTDFEFDNAARENTDNSIQKFLAYIDKNYEKGDEDLIRRSFSLINRVVFDYSGEPKAQSPSVVKVNKVLSMYHLNQNQ